MENERSLAHVEIITNIQPIPDAQKIEVATVLGWECVIKKGEFKIGEKIIYVEVDSVLPDVPEFEFLRDRKFRIRTIKLLKQVSQGLLLPLSTLNKVSTDKVKLSSLYKDFLQSNRYLFFVINSLFMLTIIAFLSNCLHISES